MAPEQAQAHFEHVSACGYCGALLKEAVSDLNEETTALEEKQIVALKSARSDWQHRLARQIAGTIAPDPVSWWMRWRPAPRLALAAAGLLAVAIVGYRYEFQRTQEKQVGSLLAQAAGERRPSELRMVGAPYVGLGKGVQREPASTFLNTPGALLKAEALIYDQMASHPSDSVWLHAKAQADLLDGKQDAAAATLARALQLDPKSPEILTDLATAYFQQKNYAAAYEALSQVLVLRPNDPLALFNRAIVSENQFLYRQALDDWEHYLNVDPHSQWANEAQGRAEAVRKKLENHDQSRAAPLLSPAQLVEAADNPEGRLKVDERVEEYLDEAVSSWLPKAYSEAAAPGDPAFQQALFFLADLTSRQHSDHWLLDLLRGASAPNFPQAVADLARAAQANLAGAYEKAREHAARAEQLFQASGNVAGSLRAQFERTFSAQLLRDSKACRQQASVALAESERHSYPWLHIQLGLEKSVCLGLMGDIGGDEKVVRRALERAEQNGYKVLFLRALGFIADDKLETGDSSGAWQLASAGLERYWSEQSPSMRGYNLYTEGSYIAEATGQPELQLAMSREAVALIDSDRDLSMRAMAHTMVAYAGMAAHRHEIAEVHYAEAARLYSRASPTGATRSNRIEIEIRMAQLEARQGRFDTALARLTRVQSETERLTNNYLALMFYSTLGEVQLRQQHVVEAEQALWPALELAELKLASLKSEAQRVSWSKDAAPVYLAMAEAELVQGREQESLEMYEWYLSAAQRVGKQPLDSPLRKPGAVRSLPEAARLTSRLPLLSGVTVLAYGLLPDGMAIWAYDDRGVMTRWFQGPTQDLQELSARFYDLSSDPRSEMSAVRRDAQRLYQLLIAPVEERLTPGRTLMVEGEESMARLPFEALLDSEGHYLVERTPIVHSLGQSPEAWLHRDVSISPALPALIVGSTASSQVDGLIKLPDVAAEADTVASSFHSPHVLKGGEATLSRVKNELPSAAVFHFAGHSLFTADKAGLMLIASEAPGDRPLLLDADVLRGLTLRNMRLAVLSACSTASGSGGSRGFNSVTEALLRAGVPHVVASRWAVDSTEAHKFIEDYYHNLFSGASVSQATRLTSRRMLSNPPTSHPYYWSAFAAYGRP
jgi:CHAT domain-containing protein